MRLADMTASGISLSPKRLIATRACGARPLRCVHKKTARASCVTARTNSCYTLDYTLCNTLHYTHEVSHACRSLTARTCTLARAGGAAEATGAFWRGSPLEKDEEEEEEEERKRRRKRKVTCNVGKEAEEEGGL